MKINGVIGASLLSLFIFSCTSESPKDIQQEVEALMEAGDYRASIVELKSAVSKFPDNKFFREMLGKLLYLKGDLAGAEKEFDKAGMESWHLMAMYHQGKYEDIILYSEDNGISENPLVAFLSALSSLKMALINSAPPNKLPPFYTRLYSLYEEGVGADALDELNAIMAMAPDEDLFKQEFILLRTDVLTQAENYEEALRELRSLYPDWNSVVRVAFREVDLLLRMEKFEEVDRVLTPWLKGNVVYPWVNFSKAFLEFNKGSYEDALLHAQRAIQAKTESAELFWIAGESAYKLDNKETAFDLFQKAYNKQPNSIKILTSLAKTQLDLGYFDDATNLLKDSDSSNEKYSQLIGLSSSYLVAQGQTEKAIDLLEETLSKKANDRVLLKQLASIKFKEGKDTLNTTRALYDTDNKSVGAALMLIQAYLDMNDIASAKTIAADFEEVEPKSAQLMQAFIALKSNDNEDALHIASKLLEYDTKNLAGLRVAMTSAYNLNRFNDAFHYSKQLVKYAPASTQSATDFVYLYTKKNPEDAKFANLDSELTDISKVWRVSEVVVRKLLANRDFSRAWEVLSGVTENTSEIINLKISTLLLLERKNDAINLAVSEYGERPETVDSFLMLASVYEQLGKNAALLKLVANTPVKLENDWRVIIGKLNVFRSAGDFEAAEKELAKLNNARFPVSLYKKFEGELALAEKKYQKARDSFKSSNQLQRDFGTVVLLAKSHFLDGQVKDAVELLYKAVNNGTAKQTSELHSVAEFMLLTGSYEKAAAVYERIINMTENDHAAFNNLADTQIKSGLYREAATNAAKAAALSKNSAYLDTLANALFYTGDYDGAIDTVLELQVEREINVSQALLLAKAYVKLDRNDDARALKALFYELSDTAIKNEWDKIQ